MARYVKFFGLGGGTDGFITGSCNDIQTTSYLQANGPEADINVAIIPKGTGAIVAACPDGTTTGGNARGQYAVDLQRVRSDSSQVAGYNFDVLTGGRNNKISANLDGYRFIGGGYQNTITAAGYSVIAGGYQNSIISGGSSWNTISGGRSNTAYNSFTTIGGGFSNVVSSDHSVVSGGQSNTASTNTHATVVGGLSNTASGQYSVAGGASNIASGQGAVVFGNSSTASNLQSFAIGTFCTASGFRSFAQGQDSQAIAYYSRAFGYYVKGYLYGQTSFANFGFNQIGDAQQSLLTARKQDELSSAATTVLSLDGTGTTNLIIPDGTNRLWSAKITATAFVSAVSGTTLVLGDSYMAEYTVLFKRVGGVSSVVGTNAGSVIADTNMISSAFTFAAGASQELAITFKAPTTANADTFRCVAKVELVEVAY